MENDNDDINMYMLLPATIWKAQQSEYIKNKAPMKGNNPEIEKDREMEKEEEEGEKEEKEEKEEENEEWKEEKRNKIKENAVLNPKLKKNLAPRYRHVMLYNLINKILTKGAKKQNSRINKININNLYTLCKDATKERSSKYISNEKVFYDFVQKNNLLSMVKNKSKKDKYIGSSWLNW